MFLKIAALVGAATDDPFNHNFQIMERLIRSNKNNAMTNKRV